MINVLGIKRAIIFITICLFFFPIAVYAKFDTNYNNNELNLETNLSDEFVEFNDSNSFDNEPISEVYDPLEGINRKFFNLSIWLDKTIVSKVDKVYKYIIPKYVRLASVNMVNNFNEPLNAVNHLFQFKFVSFLQITCRFLLNSTLGLLGTIDVASTLNLAPNPNDLGYTLTYYHVGDGFYVFVPFLGPYTLKTGVATITSGIAYSQVLQMMIDVDYIYTLLVEGSSKVFYYLENRSTFVEVLSSSIDGYALMKSAYIQNRKFNFKKLKQSW